MTVTEIETALRSHGYSPTAAASMAAAVVKHASEKRGSETQFTIQNVTVDRQSGEVTFETNAGGVIVGHVLPASDVRMAEIRDAVSDATDQLREKLLKDVDGPETERPANAADDPPVQIWGKITAAMDQNMLITSNNGAMIIFLFLATGVALSDRLMVAIAFAVAGVSYLANVAQSMERTTTAASFFWIAALTGLGGYVYAGIRLLV